MVTPKRCRCGVFVQRSVLAGRRVWQQCIPPFGEHRCPATFDATPDLPFATDADARAYMRWQLGLTP